MSMTFTLPVISAEHLSHGHTPSHAYPRSHQRNRANSRLAPPFLPRIPSESLFRDDHEHPFQDAKSVEQHENHHNHNSFHANSLTPAPIAEPSGLPLGKRKSPIMETSHSAA